MTGLTRAALIDLIIGVMEREGGRLAEWHGWRCSYPDRYGDCDCNREVAANIANAVLPLIADAIEAKRDEHFREYGNEESQARGYDWGLTHATDLVRSYMGSEQ